MLQNLSYDFFFNLKYTLKCLRIGMVYTIMCKERRTAYGKKKYACFINTVKYLINIVVTYIFILINNHKSQLKPY